MREGHLIRSISRYTQHAPANLRMPSCTYSVAPPPPPPSAPPLPIVVTEHCRQYERELENPGKYDVLPYWCHGSLDGHLMSRRVEMYKRHYYY